MRITIDINDKDICTTTDSRSTSCQDTPSSVEPSDEDPQIWKRAYELLDSRYADDMEALNESNEYLKQQTAAILIDINERLAELMHKTFEVFRHHKSDVDDQNRVLDMITEIKNYIEEELE